MLEQTTSFSSITPYAIELAMLKGSRYNNLVHQAEILARYACNFKLV